MTGPVTKGWCPGAHRPMMSGDGLVVRLRPFRAELSADQVSGLTEIAAEFGNGVLDLTSRANIQIRGISESAHQSLLIQLNDLGLIDTDPALESKRNILMPHSWVSGDTTDRLHKALMTSLSGLPAMPAKMGFALDTAKAACLQNGSADFRFELDESDHLILRADGCPSGLPVAEDRAMDALREMVDWFVSTGGRDNGRMRRHVMRHALPSNWANTRPRAQTASPTIGRRAGETILGAPLGKINAEDLSALMKSSGATHMRLMLGRMFLLKNASLVQEKGFVTKPSPLMQVHACPGAPFCPQATVSTMEVARTLASRTGQSLHVSGCAKGCAYPNKAAITLVGRNGQFDLVLEGRPWDEPCQCGVNPFEMTKKAN